ncbi:MAG: Succinyl-CoA--L-malate CoA-transferase beta subunit [Alphaproteobacteria bacterium MarineAlpha3_Bin3]|nr:MAG: Succinyl-CoA--L-malate CoA-transferase beta subunit [Alphaproteobacteria bacterium MarineAlpha3_Bin3]
MTDTVDRPLSGVRVTGLEQYIAGPYCTMLLADTGAEVIKIERPGGGDPRRQMPPFAEKDGRKKGAGFMGYNRNKKSLCLNLRDPKGQEVFRKLVASSDVVVENLRPGSMAKLGLGYREMRRMNPQLVWAIISGFGQLDGYRGPYSDRPAFDIVAEAMSGMMNLVGYDDKPPSGTVYGMADIVSGIIAAYGVLQALFMRQRTGRGQLVDSAMLDNLLSLNETMVTLYSVAGQEQKRGVPTVFFPRGAYQTKDGYLAVHVPDNIIWKRFCEVMERSDLIDDERSATSPARAQNHGFLDPIISEFMATMTRDEAVGKFNAHGVPVAPVYTAEDVFADPHIEARGMLMPIDDPEVGTYRFARTAPMLEENAELPRNPAPSLGQHTREILEGLLDYSSSEVDALRDHGVVETGE